MLTEVPFAPGHPSWIVAQMVKGKRVSQRDEELHFRGQDFEVAIAELGTHLTPCIVFMTGDSFPWDAALQHRG